MHSPLNLGGLETRLAKRQLEIIDILSRSKGELKMREILESLKEPPAERTLRDDLAALRREGVIGFKGHGRNAVWFLMAKVE